MRKSLFVLLLALGVSTSPIGAAAVTVVDVNGPDDEPGQKDLNSLTDLGRIAPDTQPGLIAVQWTHDIIETSGANTGDSCAIFDADGDGFADYMLCATWQNSRRTPLSLVDGSPKLYICPGDDDVDNCDGNAETVPTGAVCSISLVGDVFGPRRQAQADTDQDVQIYCEIDLADVDNGRLTNVCSYPSREPTSDPSDCVVEPSSVFLTVAKRCNGGIGGPFDFELDPASLGPNATADFQLGCNEQTETVRIDEATDYLIRELDVADDVAVDAVCTLTLDGQPVEVGSFDVPNRQMNLPAAEINGGQSVRCVFTNSAMADPGAGKIIVTKVSEGAHCIATWFFGNLGKFDLCVADDLFAEPPAFQTRSGNQIVFDNLDPQAPPLGYDRYRLTDLGDPAVTGDELPIGPSDIAGKHLLWEKSPIEVIPSRYADFLQLSCELTEDDNFVPESSWEIVPYAGIQLESNPEYLGHLAIVDLAPGETVECRFVNVRRGELSVSDLGVDSYVLYALTDDGPLAVATVMTDGDGEADRVDCLPGVETYCYNSAPGHDIPLSQLRPELNDIGFGGGYQLCPAGEAPGGLGCEAPFTLMPGDQITL